MDKYDIGRNIRIARTMAGLTQRELADKLGVTWEMISRYETNKVNPFNKIQEISRILKIPLSFLLGETTFKVEDSSTPFKQESLQVVPYITNPRKQLFKSTVKIKTLYPIGTNITDTELKKHFVISTDKIDSFEDIPICKDSILLVIKKKKYKTNDTVLYSIKKDNKIKLITDLYKHIIHNEYTYVHGKILLLQKHF